MNVASENKDWKFYQDTLRILLILYYFSDNHSDENYPARKKVFSSEVRLQKIDFLIRYPSYLCYELIEVANQFPENKESIKNEISRIFGEDEPKLRTQEMVRFFYGAFEPLDKTILFLKTYNFIHYDSRRGTDLRKIDKKYYLTDFALKKIEGELAHIQTVDWYFKRCELIKKYFGTLTGTELKIMQYKHPEYKATLIGDYIKDIEDKTRELFKIKFQSKL